MRPGKTRLPALVIVSFLCGTLGLGLGATATALLRPTHPVPVPEATLEESMSESEPPPIPEPAPADVLSAIDELIELGDYRKAHREWLRAAAMDRLKDEPIVRVRWAIILEGMQDFREAEKVYEQLAHALPWTSRLGKIRCWLSRHQFERAEADLANMEFSLVSVPPPDSAVRAEVRYLRACVLLHQTVPTPENRLAPRWQQPKSWVIPGGHILRLALREWGGNHGNPRVLAHLVSWEHPRDDMVNRPPSPDELDSVVGEALRTNPEHPWANWLRLEWARAEADKEPGRALRIFHELLQNEDLPQDVRIAARCELAWHQVRLGEKHLAKSVLMNAIDSRPDGPLAPWAWYQVGRIQTDFAEYAVAIRSYRTCLSRASGLVRLAAGLALASVYLHEDSPYEARLALEEVKRNGLRTGPYWIEAAFLDTFTRFRIGGGPKGKIRSIRDELFLTLSNLPEDLVVGPLGTWLRCQVHRDLSLAPPPARQIDRAVAQAGGQLAAELTWDLIMAFLHEGQETAARSHLGNLLIADDQTLAAKAHLLLAKLELKNGRPQACLQLCLQMPLPASDQRGERLRLMGEAYAQLGDSKRAADCFGGREPLVVNYPRH